MEEFRRNDKVMDIVCKPHRELIKWAEDELEDGSFKEAKTLFKVAKRVGNRKIDYMNEYMT